MFNSPDITNNGTLPFWFARRGNAFFFWKERCRGFKYEVQHAKASMSRADKEEKADLISSGNFLEEQGIEEISLKKIKMFFEGHKIHIQELRFEREMKKMIMLS